MGGSEPGALAGINAVVHLAGEPVAQRWTAAARERILHSRVEGTRALVAAMRAAAAAGADQRIGGGILRLARRRNPDRIGAARG